MFCKQTNVLSCPRKMHTSNTLTKTQCVFIYLRSVCSTEGATIGSNIVCVNYFCERLLHRRSDLLNKFTFHALPVKNNKSQCRRMVVLFIRKIFRVSVCRNRQTNSS